MKKVISGMRGDGAEIVVFFMHWGEEEQRSPNKNSQQKYAQALADAGVDIIFASHPHVLQRVDMLSSSVTGKKTLVAYSLGNFISNQRTRYHVNRNPPWTYNEDAMILNVKIAKPFGGTAQISSVEYLPTWTFMYYKGSQRYYVVVPLDKAVQSPEAFGIKTTYDKNKSKKSLNDTNKLMADAVSKGILKPMILD